MCLAAVRSGYNGVASAECSDAIRIILPCQAPMSPQPHARSGYQGVVVFVVVVLCYLVLDLNVAAIEENLRSYVHSDVVMSLLLGAFLSQYVLLATWAVLGPQTWFVRQLLANLGMVTSIGCVLLSSPGVNPDLLGIFLVSPLLFVCLQLPLWVARFVLGWRISTARNPERGFTDSRKITLTQLFAATTVVAIALAPVRWLSADSVEALFSSVASTGIGLSVAVPCAWSAMAARNLVKATLAVTFYSAFLATSAVIFVTLAEGYPGAEIVGMIMAFAISFIGITHLILVAVRQMGFLLYRAPKRPATP